MRLTIESSFCTAHDLTSTCTIKYTTVFLQISKISKLLLDVFWIVGEMQNDWHKYQHHCTESLIGLRSTNILQENLKLKEFSNFSGSIFLKPYSNEKIKPLLSSYLLIIRLLCGSFPVLSKAHQSEEKHTNVTPFPIIDSSSRVLYYLQLNHRPDQNLKGARSHILSNYCRTRFELVSFILKTYVTDQDKPKTDQKPKTLVASKTATN